MTRMYEVWDPDSNNIVDWYATEAEAHDCADELDRISGPKWTPLVIAVTDDDGMYERIPRRPAPPENPESEENPTHAT